MSRMPKIFISGLLVFLAIYYVVVNEGWYLKSSDDTYYYSPPEERALATRFVYDDEPCCTRSCTTPDNVSSCCLKCSDVSEWPTADTSNISEGTYVNSGKTLQPDENENKKSGRVLLYVTTHFSQQHAMYLKYCWPMVLARRPLLQKADVAVYLNPSKAENRKEAMGMLKETFADNNLVVYLRENAGYATGATDAMTEAVTNDYFSGYDWVIRLNPDVIIRDDSYLTAHMDDPLVSALLINCAEFARSWPPIVHTDFFMIRPHLLSKDSFPKEVFRNNAERSFTRSIQTSVLDKQSHRWIPDSSPKSIYCRAGDRRDFNDGPIVHVHALHPHICVVPEADVESTKAVFTEPWPSKWFPVR